MTEPRNIGVLRSRPRDFMRLKAFPDDIADPFSWRSALAPRCGGPSDLARRARLTLSLLQASAQPVIGLAGAIAAAYAHTRPVTSASDLRTAAVKNDCRHGTPRRETGPEFGGGRCVSRRRQTHDDFA